MSFKQRLRSLLMLTKLPTYYMFNHNQNEKTYIVYTLTNENDSSSMDNNFESMKYDINIRVFSKGDFDNDVENLKTILKENNFIYGFGAEDYDSTTGYYCKSMYFEYIDFFNAEKEDEIDPDFGVIHPTK